MRQITIKVPEGRRLRKAVTWLIGTIFLLYLCYVVREIWLPLGLAFLLAMILDPVVDRMEARGWSRRWATTFIFAGFLVISGGLAILAYPFVLDQLATLQSGFEKYFPDTSHKGLVRSFQELGLTEPFANLSANAVASTKKSFQNSSQWLTTYGLSMATNLIWIVIIPIIAFYSLRDFHLILAKALVLIPSRHRDLVQNAVVEVTAVFGKYIRGLAIVSFLNGTATAIMLAVLGVPGALILGVVAGLLYSVPYLGAVLTVLLTAAVAFVGGGLDMMLSAVGLSLILHQIVFDQIVSPKILGGYVGLHPILSIIALLVGNLLLGIIGMLLAVPVAACIQMAVVAVLPNLSQEIELPSASDAVTDTVASIEQETKEDHQKLGATIDIHAAVGMAVEAIEADAADVEVSPPDEQPS